MPVNVQIRVFRRSQNDGEERLEPTEDVVASPPRSPLRRVRIMLPASCG
jgi:fimbrial chaperone protein